MAPLSPVASPVAGVLYSRLTSLRRHIRGPRQSVFPLVRHFVRIAEALHEEGHARLGGRQGGKCASSVATVRPTLGRLIHPEQAQSTLSLLSPLRRALLGVPFLYQRISSTTPITALVATKCPTTTFSVLRLDGTTDWLVAQRAALLAWTGHTLSPSPRVQTRLPLAHWGSTYLTGRGLAALAAPGYTYTLTLAAGEDMVLHPSHVVAYSVAPHPPLPLRLKSTRLHLQVPALPPSVTRAAGRLVPGGLASFWTAMRDTDTYRFLARTLFAARTAARRSIWGDRLFLHFRGPTTILMSSRGVRVAEVLTKDDVNEIADTEAGVVADAVELARKPRAEDGGEEKDAGSKGGVPERPLAIRVATVGKDGKVKFEEKTDLNEFVGR